MYSTNSRARIEGCEIWCNMGPGVNVREGGDPSLFGCTLRDHNGTAFKGSGCGVYVHADSAGKATGGAGSCIFARNSGGDVVREPPQQPVDPPTEPPQRQGPLNPPRDPPWKGFLDSWEWKNLVAGLGIASALVSAVSLMLSTPRRR